MARERGTDDAVRITTASAGRHEEIAVRQRRYLLSMGLRSVCFVGAIVAFLVHISWLWPILIVGALVLPYIAVVLANTTRLGGDGFELLDQGSADRQLGAGRRDDPSIR